MACREKYLLGPAEMKLAFSTFPEASTKTFIRILMVPLIVFCADLETTGETCCRTSPGLAFPAGAVLASAAGVGAGALALWRSLRALEAEGLTASAGAGSGFGAALWASGTATVSEGTDEFEETELPGCAAEEWKSLGPMITAAATNTTAATRRM